jgi:hypothetical protein
MICEEIKSFKRGYSDEVKEPKNEGLRKIFG